MRQARDERPPARYRGRIGDAHGEGLGDERFDDGRAADPGSRARPRAVAEEVLCSGEVEELGDADLGALRDLARRVSRGNDGVNKHRRVGLGIGVVLLAPLLDVGAGVDGTWRWRRASATEKIQGGGVDQELRE